MKKLLVVIALLPFAALGQENFLGFDPTTALYEKINFQLNEGKAKEAMTTFKEVLSAYQKEHREQEIAQGYFAMALALALNEHYKESIRFHKKAIKAHRKYRKDEPTEIEINLGLTYQLAGKNNKAKRYFDRKVMSEQQS
ncbi:hypothetical protein [Chryseosolibacter indicus]|uniref:Tetratricopeptide repeat protein n=1 Tax=Chryseosolibacter indicus TaxID=2782351 RepID=A0ABS5VNS3_9BACT|nr:hypothetical protein [Chryseosolibacter indicus]MBT1703078.1 hypothetical protein [Chryseosolibacter indicus]